MLRPSNGSTLEWSMSTVDNRASVELRLTEWRGDFFTTWPRNQQKWARFRIANYPKPVPWCRIGNPCRPQIRSA
jgi:regulation of enolase protein 1 (concanavalin A-like superfamily)